MLLPRAFSQPPTATNTPPNWVEKLAAIGSDPVGGPLVYAALTATTCIGRVLGDRHWCSDVAAGWLLGSALAHLTFIAEAYGQQLLQGTAPEPAKEESQ